MIDATATIRGLTIGKGTSYRFNRWPAGLLGSAPIRESDIGIPRRDGVTAGQDLLGGRRVEFELVIIGTSRADVESKLATLSTAFAAEAADELLLVRIAGSPSEYALFGRCRGALAVLGTRFVSGVVAEARCSFVATDPIRYGTSSSQQITIAAHTIPATLPFTLGLYGEQTISVAGSVDVGRWTVTFQAPAGGTLINPRILHVGQNKLVQVDVTVPASGQLVLDGYVGRAVSGTEIVPTSVSEWFALTPGNNTLRFSAADGSHVSSTATIAWRPGWS